MAVGASAGAAVSIGVSKRKDGFFQISVVKARLRNWRQGPRFRHTYPGHAERALPDSDPARLLKQPVTIPDAVYR
jgi:hypothetical protein